MRQLTFIIFLLTSITLAFGQKNKNVKREPEPDFETTGEQEDYWTERLFKFDYKKKHYKRFKGEIVRIDSVTLRFDDIIVKHNNSDRRLNLMLEEGILIPWEPGLRIYLSKELTDLNPTFKIKRFRLMVHRFNIANPFTYFIELTNRKATKDMDILEFINGAKLTFLKGGWLML